MNLSNKVMQGEITKLCLLVVTLAAGFVSGGGACERGKSWWDRQRGACIPCTRCEPTRKLAVKYPCELHRDTVCQSLYEVRIWPFNTPKRIRNHTVDKYTNSSELSSDYEYYEYTDYNREVSDSSSENEVEWDLQTSTLTLAASGCVVFFVVVLFLSLYHAKQWRILKQALRSDVQDLSAKLKLMEAGGETPTEPVVSTDHHIYCNIHVGKDSLLGPASTKKGLGNVYTQEKHSS